MPILLYVSSNLPVPQWFVKDVTTKMYKFIWNNKPDKIKRNTLIGNIKDGGLKMIDFENMVKAQKLMWIKRIYNNNQSSWKAFPEWLTSPMKLTDFLKCNINHENLPFDLPLFYNQESKFCLFSN